VASLKDIADKLGSKPTTHGFVCKCPAHDDKSPSLQVWEDTAGFIRFKCYAGCTYEQISLALKTLGIDVTSKRSGPLDRILTPIHEGVALDGTPAQAYLLSRRITAFPGPSVLCYQKDAWEEPDGSKYGALIGILRNYENKIVAIQKIFIDADGKKAPIEVVKRTSGKKAGAATSLPGKKPTVLVEGLEDGLSIWQSTGSEVLVCYGLDFIKLPLSAGMEVIVARDNDPVGSKPDLKLKKQLALLKKKGVDFKIAVPETIEGQEKTDFNDMLVHFGAEKIVELIKNAQPPAAAVCDKTGDLSEKEALDAMNDRYAVVNDNGNVLVFKEELDEVLDRHVLQKMSFTDMRNYFLNKSVLVQKNNKTEVASLGDFWLSHKDRRQYDSVVFNPGYTNPSQYNLWRGWAITPKKGDWSLLKHHMKTIICSDRDDLYNYLVMWLARGVQILDAPGEVAIVMRGQRGTGKGTLASAYGSLFGEHFLHINQAKHLTGSFNAHLRNTLMLYADEAFWAGDKQGESVLKTLITEDRLTVEAKGQDVVSEKNRVKLIVSSNNDWVVPAGLEERRFAVYEVNDKKIQDKEYFRAINDQLEDGGLEGFLHDLLTMDISEFEVRDVPNTLGLFEQKVQSMDTFTKWWFEKLQDGRFLSTDDDWPKEMHKDALHENMRQFYSDVGITRKPSKVDMSMRLKKLIPPDCKEVRDSRGRKLKFIPLKYMRDFFEKKIRQPVEWEEADSEEPASKKLQDGTPY